MKQVGSGYQMFCVQPRSAEIKFLLPTRYEATAVRALDVCMARKSGT